MEAQGNMEYECEDAHEQWFHKHLDPTSIPFIPNTPEKKVVWFS